jgi:hypothetical protein
MDFKKILDSLLPYVLIGVGIAIAVGLLFMFFSIAIWGIVIGGVLWIGAMVKQYFFPAPSQKDDAGRIIEHDDKL